MYIPNLSFFVLVQLDVPLFPNNKPLFPPNLFLPNGLLPLLYNKSLLPLVAAREKKDKKVKESDYWL